MLIKQLKKTYKPGLLCLLLSLLCSTLTYTAVAQSTLTNGIFAVAGTPYKYGDEVKGIATLKDSNNFFVAYKDTNGVWMGKNSLTHSAPHRININSATDLTGIAASGSDEWPFLYAAGANYNQIPDYFLTTTKEQKIVWAKISDKKFWYYKNPKAIAVDPNGTLLATIADDNILYIYNGLNAWTFVDKIKGFMPNTLAVYVSPETANRKKSNFAPRYAYITVADSTSTGQSIMRSWKINIDTLEIVPPNPQVPEKESWDWSLASLHGTPVPVGVCYNYRNGTVFVADEYNKCLWASKSPLGGGDGSQIIQVESLDTMVEKKISTYGMLAYYDNNYKTGPSGSLLMKASLQSGVKDALVALDYTLPSKI